MYCTDVQSIIFSIVILKMPKRSRSFTVVDMPAASRRRTPWVQYARNLLQHTPVAAGAAAVGTQMVYDKARGVWSNRENRIAVANVLGDAYIKYKDMTDPDWVRRVDPQPRENPSRFVTGIVPYVRTVEEGPIHNRVTPYPKLGIEPLRRKRGSRFTRPTNAVVKRRGGGRPSREETVVVENERGDNVVHAPTVFGNDAGDLVDEPMSNVRIGDDRVTLDTVQSLSMIGGRPIMGDDGDGAVMIRKPSGKYVWRVGYLEFPVQYTGRKVVPFSFSGGRYQSIIPNINVR